MLARAISEALDGRMRTDDLARLRQMCRDGTARETRLSTGTSLSEIAADISPGLRPTTVQRWETGKQMPRGALAAGYYRALQRLMKVVSESGASARPVGSER
jgi:hypothetical protein